MAFRFSDTYSMFDITPVENIFLEEYMLRAPSDYVKVYLYGLRQCYHPDSRAGIEAFSRSLGMEEASVRDAFSYWEKQGVLRRVSDAPPTYQYNNLKAMLSGDNDPEDSRLYQYREFNNNLQALFGARLLAPAEYTRAAEWVEELKMNKDVILLMIRRAIADRGPKVSFAYLEKMATTWSKSGLTTKEMAQEYIRTRGSAFQGVTLVLKALGLRRAPTVAEEQLYQKWTCTWGFTPEAIQAAMGEMTKIANPNFAYLDKVLQSAHKRGSTDAASVTSDLEQRALTATPVREVLSALGWNGSVTEDLQEFYESWRAQGFDQEAILLAARYVKRRGGKSMQDVADILARYAKRNLFIGSDIENYIAELSRERDAAQILKSRANDESAITPADLTRYRRMIASGLPAALLALAAEYATGAKEPMAFAAKIVSNWAEAGIYTADAAKLDHEQRHIAPTSQGTTTQSKGNFKQVSAQKFGQREYSEQEWNALVLDIDSLESGE